MTLIEILEKFKNEQDAVEWCKENGIINANPICFKCDILMNTENNGYRCPIRKCRAKSSLTSNTIFNNSSLPIKTLILLLYFWACDIPINKSSYHLSVNQPTVTKWYQRFRTYATGFYFLKNTSPIGGQGIIVEIDEVLMVKRKYNKGRILKNQQWMFGGVVRGDIKQCFIEMVPNRTRETLIDVIRRRIAPHSIIISDQWRSYHNLEFNVSDLHIEHYTINHSENFVDPDNYKIHTQTIEAFWSVIKRKLRSKGTNHGKDMEPYLADFLYRHMYGINDDELFNTFINDVKYFN